MSTRKSHSRKQRRVRKNVTRKKSNNSAKRVARPRSRDLSADRQDRRLRAFDALSLWRHGKAKSLSGAARSAGTTARSMWELVPSAIGRDENTGRFKVKASDRYSAQVEILTDQGALIATARGSRQRDLAGQHRATYMRILAGKESPSALEQFRGKKVGGHELLSDYARISELAQAGVLGQLDTLYVSVGGGR